MNRDISQSNSKSHYVGSPSYHCSDIKWLPRNNPIQFPIKYVDLPLWQFLIINVSRISQSNSKSQYVGSLSYHCSDIKWLPRNNPIQFPIKYVDIPLWQFLIINVSRISQPNSKSQYVGSPSYHRHHIQSSRGKPIQFQIKYTDLPLWTFLGKNILSIQETT